MKRHLLSILIAPAIVCRLMAQTVNAPIYVTLWFDTEDYILPQDDDATKRLAELLTKLDVRATFKIVGEKARVLERRGRKDVIAALKRHDIGYHSNTHSQQPTVAVYLQHAAMGVLAVGLGATLWLTRRTHAERILEWAWPLCIVLMGAVLLLYVEG